ncbi:zinc carboxypeptidase [bacterium]|nr:zinc carboxypeptidase [bacterium]
MKKIVLLSLAAVALLTLSSVKQAQSTDTQYYWMKISASDKFQRSVIASTGAAIEIVKDDYVIAYGNDIELAKIKKMGWLQASSNLAEEMRTKDFPTKDAAYHNYAELTEAISTLAKNNPDIVQMSSIVKTQEGRDIWALRITSDLNTAPNKPAVIFMGGHHAREHLSVEMPIMLAQYLVDQYRAGNQRIISLVNSRDIHIIPVVNPDGMEYDIKDGSYKMWRKNRTRNANGTYGVDLNRNYGYQWGTGGSSADPGSDTYKGPTPFSEIESKAIRDYVETHTNITVLLTIHSFSKLILYPWGHKYSGIETGADKQVHEVMARKMAEWNGYTPEQSSELYIASGDTTDWSYGAHKIISFTFELDPANNGFGGGGFYPGAGVIQPVFQKNIEPFLYLIDYSDNPYRALNVGIGPIGP